ncbi:uncharacterized protein LOC123292782 [Chrysoperla carnea]|uniref:uncharacterized protein LOC123292782 n=1 Tax=Chrysoperla carnea TaxID=189513 RepID=UPI001D06978A|nr:uncharacterized protein LOC123292782 [Chrysoperla carnea]
MKLKLIFFSLLAIILLINNSKLTVDGAKILGLFPSPSKSHLILGHALLKDLAKKGHEVTMVSPFPLSKPVPNYRDIPMADLYKVMQADDGDAKGNQFLTKYSGLSPINIILTVYEMGYNISKAAMEDANVQELIKSKEKFDVVISEVFMNEVLFAFADHFKAHAIGFSTVGATEWTNDLVGNPNPYAITPELFLGFTDRMTFFERIINAGTTLFNEGVLNFVHLPKQEDLRKKHLPHTKPLSDILNNVSLILLNSHPSLSSPRALVPNMIEIGGFHVDPPKPLPADLKKILDEATDGVVYFSMGSNFQSKELPEEIRNEFLNAFSKLKQTVLWKWEDDKLPGQPKNVKISKWFPQSDLLAHPNVKIFMTHGGLLSTTESVARGVPMVGIPVFADQKLNMAKAVSLGYGLKVDFQNITSEAVYQVLSEIISNPKYSENVKKRSAVLNDRLVPPIDEAVYWVEYVLRHNGALHLRSARKDLNIFQYLLLDIIGLIGGVLLLFLLIILFIVKKVLYLFKASPKKSKLKKKLCHKVFIYFVLTMDLKILPLCLFSIILLSTQYESVNGAKILALFPSASKSHLILGQALLKGLAKKGHQVTMVSPIPLPKPVPNYRDIVIETDLKAAMHPGGEDSGNKFLTQISSVNPVSIITAVYEMGYNLAKVALEDPKVQELIKSKETFDIVIPEIFMNEVFFAFADHFKAQLIVFSTVGATEWTNDLVGNPNPYAITPEIFLGFTDRMTFVERIINTGVTLLNEVVMNFVHLPKQEELRQKHLPHTKPLSEISKNVSLILLNSHPSLSTPRALVPNMIEIGGFHVDQPKPLPADLKKTLDEATNGVVYFSMGSNFQSKELPEEIRNEFLNAFSKLKQTVLWKWEDDKLPGQPKNVKISKWFPQSDLLAHPNVKVFMTHGGLLSTTESVARGVPMVGIPVFADQKMNMAKAVSLGYGLKVDFQNITSEAVYHALSEIISNTKYSENVKKRSAVLNDRLVPPIDEAVYWVEYVLRHNGAPHLRSARTELNIFQYLLLDIIGLVGGVLILVLLVVIFIVKKVLSLFKSSPKKLKSKKKTN